MPGEVRAPRARFAEVIAEVAAGSTAERASRRLGMSHDLAEAMIEEATRLGLLTTYSSMCGGCTPTRTSACVGCPLTRLRPSD